MYHFRPQCLVPLCSVLALPAFDLGDGALRRLFDGRCSLCKFGLDLFAHFLDLLDLFRLILDNLFGADSLSEFLDLDRVLLRHLFHLVLELLLLFLVGVFGRLSRFSL